MVSVQNTILKTDSESSGQPPAWTRMMAPTRPVKEVKYFATQGVLVMLNSGP